MVSSVSLWLYLSFRQPFLSFGRRVLEVVGFTITVEETVSCSDLSLVDKPGE
jgi:hypothetical protein